MKVQVVLRSEIKESILGETVSSFRGGCLND